MPIDERGENFRSIGRTRHRTRHRKTDAVLGAKAEPISTPFTNPVLVTKFRLRMSAIVGLAKLGVRPWAGRSG